MIYLLDNRTLTFAQVIVSSTLFIVMLLVWRTQRTYAGFGRWTFAKLPNALGWLLISLRGLVPNWVSIIVGNGLLVFSSILIYEGLREFRGKPFRDILNNILAFLFAGVFLYYTWASPDINMRIGLVSVLVMFIFARASGELFFAAPDQLRSSYWFTATAFTIYTLILFVRAATITAIPSLSNPFDADLCQEVLFLATNVVGIGWSFGFFMMTNHRLDLELRAAETQTRQAAMTDFLTGALNRRAFTEVSEREHQRACRYNSSLAFLMIDIDHFKHINDRHGHAGGDIMLRETVATLRAQLRTPDILARWGGEEFAVLLPETNDIGCLRVAEKLRAAMAGLSVARSDTPMCVSISIGCTLWQPSNDDTLDAVLLRADGALYQAKSRGRNCVVMV